MRDCIIYTKNKTKNLNIDDVWTGTATIYSRQ